MNVYTITVKWPTTGMISSVYTEVANRKFKVFMEVVLPFAKRQGCVFSVSRKTIELTEEEYLMLALMLPEDVTLSRQMYMDEP